MIPYWTLFAAVALPAMLVEPRQAGDRRGRWTWALVGLAVTIFVGLRYEVGTDWRNYLAIFDLLRWMPLADAVAASDPAFGALNWLASSLNSEMWLVNLICAAVFASGLFVFTARMRNPWLALAVATPYLIIAVGMGYTRQAAALGCVMWGLAGVSRRLIIRFVLWIALAAAFHKSAIIVLPIAGLAYARSRVASGLLMLATSLILYYLLLASTVQSTFDTYTDNDIQSRGAYIRVAMNIPSAVIFLWVSHRFSLAESERRLWRNFSIAALVCVPVLFLFSSTTLIDRLALYIIPLQLLVLSNLPYIVSLSKGGTRQLTLGIICYSAAVQFAWFNSGTYSIDWLPYRLYPVLAAYA